jgi:galactose mutarotase-like enzyme
MACSLSASERAGWRAIVLENEHLRVVVLPEKGADIFELVHLGTGIDVLFKTPWGLQRRGAPAREGTDDTPFLRNYEGGWQELFPSAGDPCFYRDRPVAFHGEVATSSWTDNSVVNTAEELAVEFAVQCQNPPLRLSRIIRLRAASPTINIEERVDNDDDSSADFVWGHHCVLGPPFIEEGARFELAAGSLSTPVQTWEETARLRPGQRSPWPMAEDKSGSRIDLTRVAGPDTGSHDDVFITGLSQGRAVVHNPRLDLTFVMTFDHHLFRWVVSWQPFGGAKAMPLAGSYGLGVEPWTSPLNLEEAVRAGDTVSLGAGQSLETVLSVTLKHPGEPDRHGIA